MSKIIDGLKSALSLLTKSTEENKQMLKDFIAQEERSLDIPEKKPLLPDKKEPGEGQEILTDSIETKK